MVETYPTYKKDPQSTLDYAFDWKPLTNGQDGAISDWLAVGEAIASHVITSQAGITVENSAEANGIVTVWLSGGTADIDYLVTCRVTTDSSPARVDERSIVIEVRER